MASRGKKDYLAGSSIEPRSVEEITKAAGQYEYSAQIPLRFWLRSAAALLKEADIYMREGDEETTYLLLFRHAHLVLANLLEHPDVKEPSLKQQLIQAKQEVNRNLKTLDVLKPKINQRHERYAAIVKERNAQRVESLQQQDQEQSRIRQRGQAALEQRIQHLDGHEHQDLAVSLARREFDRRATARQPSERRIPHGRDGSNDLSARLQAIRTRLEPNAAVSETKVLHTTSHHEYSYPSVHGQTDYQIPAVSHGEGAKQTQQYSRPPAIPAKPFATDTITAPPRPTKIPPSSSLPAVAAVQPDEAIDRPTYTFASSACLEDGTPLRTLFLPPTLRTTFLRLAHKNTLANLETCAFLAGTLMSNALFVSKLIVPAQVATSDTCEMTNESQLFDYVDSEKDLMVLGWIHTHPTQTCFMSSRDLHTHAGYQMMLSESIAIVCAPSKGDTTHGGDWGIYRLTDPPGKMAILNCTKPGIFHPHDVDHVYTDALRPGHVVEAKGLEFEVVDLRDS